MISIRTAALEPIADPADVVTRLRECHARIRSSLAEAQAIVDSFGTAIAPSRRAQSARNVRRYFTLGLPLHAADEDVSIVPRVGRAALTSLAGEHVLIDQCVDELALDWQIIGREGAAPSDLARHRALVEKLTGLLIGHLELEEREMFPAIEALPWAERAAIVREMRVRRA
jgi:hypothetical protein